MQRFRHPTEENTRTRVQFEGKVLRIKQSLDLKVNINWKELLPIPDGRDYPDNRGFSWHAKNGKKRKTSEDIVSKSCWAWRNVTLERGWSRISSLAKVGTVLTSRYAHSSCARMTREAKTGYTTSLTSVTSPNSWTTYRAYATGYWYDFFRGFSFLSIFRVPGKTFVVRVGRDLAVFQSDRCETAWSRKQTHPIKLLHSPLNK